MPLLLTAAATVVLLALGGALVLQSSTESAIAARYRDGVQAFYAAEAALERGIARLRETADWSALAAEAVDWRELEPGLWVRDAGGGLMSLRAEALGPGGARRTVEVAIARSGPGVRVTVWREVR